MIRSDNIKLANELLSKRSTYLNVLDTLNPPATPVKNEPRQKPPPRYMLCREYGGVQDWLPLLELSTDFIRVAVNAKLAEVERELVGMGVQL